MEIVYRDLFLRELRKVGVEDDFFPVGSAANHSLLYLITRCSAELPISKVLEFGAGQTSLLLDRLTARLHERTVDITTIEQDQFWARKIGQQVRHPVIHAALVQKTVAGRTTFFYDSEQLDSQEDIEFAIVDGPIACSRSSRWNRSGAAGYLSDRLAADFVVIFDDTERRGESACADSFERHLTARNIPHHCSTIKAEKQQRLFCSDNFRAAAYF